MGLWDCLEENKDSKHVLQKPSKHKFGYFYINAIFAKDGNIYLKYGVSFDPEQRFKHFMTKNRRYLKDLVTLDIFEFDTLHEAYLFEKHVKDNLTYTQIFNKESMRDGFTEICETSLYNNILQLRSDFCQHSSPRWSK